jgi:hypothetical protein
VFYNVASKSWRDDPPEKEHTVVGLGPRGTWTATVIVVPTGTYTTLDPDTGKLVERTRFTEVGVRIEATELRSTMRHVDRWWMLPGHVWFYHYGTGTIIDTPAPSWERGPGGAVLTGLGKCERVHTDELVPLHSAPTVHCGPKDKGVTPARHRLGGRLMLAVGAAQESHAAHKLAA